MYSSCQKSLILCETKFRPQFHLVSDMEVKCYLKAKKKKNMKKPFINPELLTKIYLHSFVYCYWRGSLTRLGSFHFYPYPLKEDFLKFHTPRNSTSTCSPSDIQILCDFRGILLLNPLDLFFVDLSVSLLSYTGCPKKSFRLLNLNDFANF